MEVDTTDQTAKDIALMMFRTATLRSGYMLRETASFADSVEQLMRKTLGISLDEVPEEEEIQEEESGPTEKQDSEKIIDMDANEDDQDEEKHDEL